jgi:hypothetical protein
MNVFGGFVKEAKGLKLSPKVSRELIKASSTFGLTVWGCPEIWLGWKIFAARDNAQ